MAGRVVKQLVLFGDPVKSSAPDPPTPPLPVRRPPALEEGAEAAVPVLWSTLAACLPGLGRITLAENRSSIVSVRWRGRGSDARLDLRLHWCFVHARGEVLDAVAGFARAARTGNAAGRRRYLPVLQEFHRVHGGPTPPSRRLSKLRPRGRHHDLLELRDELGREHFDDRLRPPITWGRARPVRRRRGRRRTIRLGSYDPGSGVVRIHPILDQSWVPRMVVASVVYHEMLHVLLPAAESGGRRCFHGEEFRRREALFPSQQAAEEWLDGHLGMLLEG